MNYTHNTLTVPSKKSKIVPFSSSFPPDPKYESIVLLLDQFQVLNVYLNMVQLAYAFYKIWIIKVNKYFCSPILDQ